MKVPTETLFIATTDGWTEQFTKALAPTAPIKAEAPLDCQGSELFWSLRLDRNGAVFSVSGEAEEHFHISPWIEAEGSGNYFSFIVWMTKQSVFEKNVAVIIRGDCTDGDSDSSFQAAIIMADGTLYSGCCRGGPSIK